MRLAYLYCVLKGHTIDKSLLRDRQIRYCSHYIRTRHAVAILKQRVKLLQQGCQMPISVVVSIRA